MKPQIFKAYDIRGKYPTEVNEKSISEITRCLGQYFKLKTKNSRLKTKIVIGRDIRLSSPKLYRAAISQLKSKNLKLKTIEAGLVTTPMLYFLVNYFKADVGIIVTASHNPKNYNGLKVVGKRAIPISGKEIFRIINNR
ncbi:hypothetical protein COS61_01475 [Candidatus Wolfebacteria bacterium CG03_land_8_20_14_0_80_40_12]|uniref:Alpha-D-phosphohexomutase alpha/beta/alpha domain-containing protein n=1 Tax=Candidatus Wolfebacteria bacterium CG03_land_8_20_14_0_80_40_12 TaxID=1975069 RepID=A0A2M7B5N4_9BACT|nr:MAG: hypothetical protein COS61_01475 [Candidatus Wolfebacteria bacterium CG03_land_8_20_14_0_80_40_12]